jgi:hypothetical protein
MKLLGTLVGFFFLLVGVAIVFWPAGLMTIGYYLVTPVGLYIAAALRIGLGLVLLLAAPVSRAPNTLRVFGAIVLVAGLGTPFIGVDHAKAMLDWWTAQRPVFIRLSGGLPIAIGAFIAYVVVPRRAA